MLSEITDNGYSCLEIYKTYFVEFEYHILNAVHNTKTWKHKETETNSIDTGILKQIL